MILVFSEIREGSKWVPILISKIISHVYYLKLQSDIGLSQLEDKLSSCGINPVPAAGFRKVDSPLACFVGENKYKNIGKYLTDDMLLSQNAIYPGVSKLYDKLKLSFYTTIKFKESCILESFIENTRYKGMVLFVTFCLSDLALMRFPKKVKKLYLPPSIMWMSIILNKLLSVPSRFYNRMKPVGMPSSDVDMSECVFSYVLHNGVSYGTVFEKNLYYSDDKESLLHIDKILHIDYSGIDLSHRFKYFIHVGARSMSYLRQASDIFNSFLRSFFYVRSFSNIYGVLFLSGFYLRYTNYLYNISKVSLTRFALIDYEILCPKPLLIAFEVLGVETIATQERYITQYYSAYGVFLDNYLCASVASIRALKDNDSYVVKSSIAVGQYRSDFLLNGEESLVPDELVDVIGSNKKLIVVLGFQTYLHFSESEVHALISWDAQISFLKDMIRLAKEIENSFIVVRFKDIEWINIDLFRHVIDEIDSMDNICISKEFSVINYPYILCSHADLVIAKHTSLGDECLSRNIPVIFYDYGHNHDNIISPMYDYNGSEIVCHEYSSIYDITRMVVVDENMKMFDHIYKLYNGFGDGLVHQRIHKILSEKISLYLEEDK